MSAIEHPPIFRLPGIPDHVTYTWLFMIVLAGLASWLLGLDEKYLIHVPLDIFEHNCSAINLV